MMPNAQPTTESPSLSVTSFPRIEAKSQSSPKGSGSGSEDLPEKGSVKGSGSGYDLPELENLQWELNSKGGWEAWHVPNGAVHRKEKTYLGYLGKRQIAKWESETPERFRALVGEWIAEKRAAKQIE